MCKFLITLRHYILNIGAQLRNLCAQYAGEEQKGFAPVSPALVCTIPLTEAHEWIERRACRRFSRSHLFTKAPSRDIVVMSYIAAWYVRPLMPYRTYLIFSLSTCRVHKTRTLHIFLYSGIPTPKFSTHVKNIYMISLCLTQRTSPT